MALNKDILESFFFFISKSGFTKGYFLILSSLTGEVKNTHKQSHI